MPKFLFFIVINLFLVMNTQAQFHTAIDTTTGEEILVGKVTIDDLTYYKGFENLRANKQSNINGETLQSISMALKDVKIISFIGTWCEDTHQYFPEFIDLLNKVGYDIENMETIALDRSKVSEDGLTEKYKIESVPTFIFLKENEEIGRFVEYPQSDNVEKDIQDILTP